MRQTKYKSFLRQLQNYGYSRETKGPGKGICRHKDFIRGRRELCQQIKRIKPTTTKAATAKPTTTKPTTTTTTENPFLSNNKNVPRRKVTPEIQKRILSSELLFPDIEREHLHHLCLPPPPPLQKQYHRTNTAATNTTEKGGAIIEIGSFEGKTFFIL